MDSSAKRRRVGGSGSDDPRCRPSKPRPRPAEADPEVDPEVNDEEVEEFFSIIRRMRDARRSFAPVPAGPRWSPAFALEDFVGPDATVTREHPPASPVAASAEPAAAPRRLDLNAEPEPEDLGEAAPRGESAA